ncbi:hypothetical protein Ancab_002868 [Ancistrocladus abbreviatus]
MGNTSKSSFVGHNKYVCFPAVGPKAAKTRPCDGWTISHQSSIALLCLGSMGSFIMDLEDEIRDKVTEKRDICGKTTMKGNSFQAWLGRSLKNL